MFNHTEESVAQLGWACTTLPPPRYRSPVAPSKEAVWHARRHSIRRCHRRCRRHHRRHPGP